MKFDLTKYPLIMFDTHVHSETRSGLVSRQIIEALKKEEVQVRITESASDCLETLVYSSNASGVIVDWDSFAEEEELDDFLAKIKALNTLLPIYIITQSHELDDTSVEILKNEAHFFWKYADTYDFMVGRIKIKSTEYLTSLLPPFFKALLYYSEQCKYVWSTPGHMGGVAFLKSPIGRIFYDYYGENVFRSDLSISVPELGSLMDHSGVNGDAERFAAKTFGADMTYFVTNGTSTSNKMVVMSCTGKGDVAIADRNCHKSLQHAFIMSDIIPIYFKPTRNAYGIIGTIPRIEFSKESIRAKIDACPLIKDKSIVPNIAIITNSTYDGLIYNVGAIKDELAKSDIPNVHFDEAWYPYAHFHPLYNGKHAMSEYHCEFHPTVYATQSTHKLLAAFSQASMIHIKNGIKPLNADLFNETYMMHTSTSPQYSIVASLDISSKMMEGQFGYRLVSESMSEAIAFRQEFHKIRRSLEKQNDWFFHLWQPEAVLDIKTSYTHHFMEIPEEDAELWMLKPGDSWHGFESTDPNFTMLDPIKITIITPGINHDATFEKAGIPAPIVSKFLMTNGVVDEKTSFYSMLFLFSIGVNKSKSMNLLSDLVLFKDAYDKNTPLVELFPELIEKYPSVYKGIGLENLCQNMHHFLKREDASRLTMNAFDKLPEQVLSPNEAYQHIVKGNCTAYPLEQLENKIVLTMLTPYPPGIPLVMPGERVTKEGSVIIDYLEMLERFDNAFPGFANDVHGVELRTVHGKLKYYVNCLDKE